MVGPKKLGPAAYGRYLIVVAGLGGLLYGVDVGIIAAALLYLSKTISLTVVQTSSIVAAVLGGSMASSLVAGLLADWVGRRRIMILSGAMFIASVGLIATSQGFLILFVGRLLQGMSGGFIAVVIPLYLAECLGANQRGRGTAIFQFMVTLGVVIASTIGMLYTAAAERAIAAAAGNTLLIRAAENHAWRGMFLAMVYPGLLFSLGTLFLVETPRWLYREGRDADALASLQHLSTESDAQAQFCEMKALGPLKGRRAPAGPRDSLLQRRYAVPFVLACVILVCTQTTGINSILGYLVVILRHAGMTAEHATQGDVIVKVIHCLMTLVAVMLVDSKGRKFLLKLGTAGIVISLFLAALLFRSFETNRIDVRQQIQAAVVGDSLRLPLRQTSFYTGAAKSPMELTVLYTYGHGNKVVTALSSDVNPVVAITPEAKDAGTPLTIRRAFYSHVAAHSIGWLVTICLALFASFFSLGPGVVVWLTLSELMPTRIRSTGMGIALLLNQGVSTAIAALFLPVIGKYGMNAMFFFWTICTVLYFLTAAFFLPETKGKTLEAIEESFARRSSIRVT